MKLITKKQKLNTVTKYGKKNGIKKLCATLYEDSYVRCSYEFYDRNDSELKLGGRLLLRQQNHTNKCSNFQRGIGGAIIDTNTWRFLSLPVKTLYPNINYNILFSKFKNYNVFEATDGTIVTLYHVTENNSGENKTNSDGRWVLSTNNSYDMDNVTHCGINFREAFYESLDKSKQSLDNLDTDKCYSFGFRHKSIHYSDEKVQGLSEYDVWFIQSVDMKKFNDNGEFAVNSVIPPKGIRIQKLIDPIDAIELLTKKRLSGIGYIIRVKDEHYKDPAFKHAILFKKGIFVKILKTCIYDIRDYSANRNEHILLWNAMDSVRTEIVRTKLPNLIDGVESYKLKLKTLVNVTSKYYFNNYLSKEISNGNSKEILNEEKGYFTVIGGKQTPVPELLNILKYVKLNNKNNNNMDFENLYQFMYMHITKDEQFKNLCKLYDKSTCVKKHE